MNARVLGPIAATIALTFAIGCKRDVERASSGRAPSGSIDVENDGTVLLSRNGVVVFAAHKLYLDDDIAAAFAAFRNRSPRGRLVIHAHPATLHGRLVRIVDLAKQAHTPYDVIVSEEEP